MTSERKFYVEHHERIEKEVVDLDKTRLELESYGSRYFCIFDVLDSPEKLNALEWGFGSISTAKLLNTKFATYEAVDIAALDMIKKNYSGDEDPEFRFSEQNLNEDLSYESESFDVVIAMMVIEHLFDPFHSFKELSRILKPGGYAFVNLPLLNNLKNRLRVLFGRLPITSSPYEYWWSAKQWDGGHLHNFNIDFIEKLADLYDLEVEAFYPVGKFPSLKKIRPTLFCGEGSFVFRKMGSENTVD